MDYGDWAMVAVWVVLFGIFLAFIPFYRKSQRRPARVYMAFNMFLPLAPSMIPRRQFLAEDFP